MNNSTQIATAAQLAASGLSTPGPQEWRKFYKYPISFGAVGAGISINQNLQLQNDAPFFAMQFTGEAQVAGPPIATLVNPPISIQIIDTGSNFPLFSSAENWDNVVGTAQLPYILPVTYMFNKNSTILFQITNNFNATLSITFSLGGFKKFYSTPASGSGTVTS